MNQKNTSLQKSYGCSTPDCQSKLQAVCFTCEKLYCFKCSLQHVQKHPSPSHNVLQIQDSIPQISKLSKRLLKQATQLLKSTSQSSTKQPKPDPNTKLSPQRFQQQLDEINFMKKQTLKVVEKFFSQISLQLVNIWQHYLKTYSMGNDIEERLVQVRKRLEVYAEPWNINETKEQILKGFFRESFQQEVAMWQEKCSSGVGSLSNRRDEIPKCPQIKIDDRVLVQLSQVLCGSISTKNYTYQPAQSKGNQKQSKLSITQQNYLHKSVTWLPIFPIKKNHCFLYNIQNKNYQIQEFQQLEYLPDYPKTIIIPNGDIHVIGGTKNEKVIDTHLVFRSSSSEVFKLSNLPVACNPSNSLVYYQKCIYLIGGINDKHEWQAGCFKYQLQGKQWKRIPSMNASKPHQSCAVFNSTIYCFGIPEQKKINIQKFTIEKNIWQDISINNFLSNPFNFAAGFSSCQINQSQILLFGGKKFLESATTNKRSTDRTLQDQVYTFQPETNSFEVKGPLFPCLGVQYGEFYPIVSDHKVYACEYLLCKTNPISRWYDNIQVMEINQKGDIESVIILEES